MSKLKFMYRHEQILAAARFLSKKNKKLKKEPEEWADYITNQIERMVDRVRTQRMKNKYDWRIGGSGGFYIIASMHEYDLAEIEVLVDPAVSKDAIVEYWK